MRQEMNRIVAALTMVAFMSLSVAAMDSKHLEHRILKLLAESKMKKSEQAAVLQSVWKGIMGPGAPSLKSQCDKPEISEEKTEICLGKWQNINAKALQNENLTDLDEAATFLILAAPENLDQVADSLEDHCCSDFSQIYNTVTKFQKSEYANLWKLFDAETMKWFEKALKECSTIDLAMHNGLGNAEFDIAKTITFAKKQGAPLFIPQSEHEKWESHLNFSEWEKVKHSDADESEYYVYVHQA